MADKDRGFIKLDRSLQAHWLWDDPEPFDKRSAWVDLLMLANHKTTKVVSRGQLIEIKRGQVARSISWLANRWHWSRDKVRRFIRTLERDGMCTLNATTNNTTITIENYNRRQNPCATDKATNNTTDNTTDNTHTINVIKNVKKNVKSIKDRLSEDDLISLTERYHDLDGLLATIDERTDIETIKKPKSYVVRVANAEGWPTVESEKAKQAEIAEGRERQKLNEEYALSGKVPEAKPKKVMEVRGPVTTEEYLKQAARKAGGKS